MTNALNEYLKERPALGGLTVLGMLLIGMMIWAKLYYPHRSVGTILFDPGLWFVFILLAPILFLSYYLSSNYFN
jgi:predicted permease